MQPKVLGVSRRWLAEQLLVMWLPVQSLITKAVLRGNEALGHELVLAALLHARGACYEQADG